MASVIGVKKFVGGADKRTTVEFVKQPSYGAAGSYDEGEGQFRRSFKYSSDQPESPQQHQEFENDFRLIENVYRAIF